MKKKTTGNLKGFRQFMQEEEGMGTVEIILIIVVLIGLVIIFKTQLRDLVTKVFEKITEDSNTVMS
jgi:Flp pilus assembly pilin Flp